MYPGVMSGDLAVSWAVPPVCAGADGTGLCPLCRPSDPTLTVVHTKMKASKTPCHMVSIVR